MIGHRKKTSHILHLILTVFFFPWALIWICAHLNTTSYNRNAEHQELLDKLEKLANNHKDEDDTWG